jgi:hypothetical protein
MTTKPNPGGTDEPTALAQIEQLIAQYAEDHPGSKRLRAAMEDREREEWDEANDPERFEVE